MKRRRADQWTPPPWRERTRKDWVIYLCTWRGRTWKDRFLFAGWLGTFLFATLYIGQALACP